jgi:hypothetical protein
MASEGQGSEGKTSPSPLELYHEILKAFDTSKCPPNVNCVGLIGTLGITVGLYVALYVIKDGLNTAGTQGCNNDVCAHVLRRVDYDVKRITDIMGKAKELFSEGRLSPDLVELIADITAQLITEVAGYYPLAIDLLTRYGRGRGQAV